PEGSWKRGDVSSWHQAAQIHVGSDVGFRGQTGLNMLNVSFVDPDPKQTSWLPLLRLAVRGAGYAASWNLGVGLPSPGRSLIDLLGFLQELHAKGVALSLHQRGIDTSTPAGKAMFQMMGVFAEFERAMIRERILAGLARARDQGTKLGRRRLEDADADKVE